MNANKDKQIEVIEQLQNDICDFIKTINDEDTLEYYKTFITLSSQVWHKK